MMEDRDIQFIGLLFFSVFNLFMLLFSINKAERETRDLKLQVHEMKYISDEKLRMVFEAFKNKECDK